MSGLIRSFAHDFGKLAEKHANDVAVIVPAEVGSHTFTFAEIQSLVGKCLDFYKQQGLQPGDVIFALMPNAVETVVCFIAALMGGYGYAPLPCVASRREVDRWINLVKPKLCITTDLISKDAKVALLSKQIPVHVLESDCNFSWLSAFSGTSQTASGSRVYLSTSGTTGEPKAMVLDGDRLWSSGFAFLKYHRLSEAQLRFWNFLPMSYLGGLFNLTLIPLCTGGSLVIDDTFSGKTFLEFWQTVERFDINAIWFVPTIVRGLLSISSRLTPAIAKQYGSKIKQAFIGTAPIDLTTKRKFEETFGITLYENFALSETTFFTSEAPDSIANRAQGSVGEILPYADVLIEQGEDPDRPGEICVRSPFLFLGYLNDEGKVSLPLDEKGYFHTGDLGELNSDCVLVLKGRSKEFIKKGGYLVSLREVEALAAQHPSVAEAAAVPTAHSFYGESFDLYVILKPGFNDDSLQDLGPFLHENLVKYKWPERIVSIAEFPKTASGKIQKHLIVSREEVKA
jgi:acyl-coenzyme A synthetase/AMP-(fatty) acid ligase